MIYSMQIAMSKYLRRNHFTMQIHLIHLGVSGMKYHIKELEKQHPKAERKEQAVIITFDILILNTLVNLLSIAMKAYLRYTTENTACRMSKGWHVCTKTQLSTNLFQYEQSR